MCALIRALILTVALATITPLIAPPANAATIPTGCQPGAFIQYDLAGTYVGTDRMLRVEVYPCGGSFIEWRGSAGDTWATYYSADRLTGGGIVLIGMTPGPFGYLDGVTNVGLKPAERGFVQLVTVNQYAQIVNVFRLKKIT